MGKHSNPSDPAPVPGNVTDDTWTKVLLGGVSKPDSEGWAAGVLRNAENARNN